jgi:class 3 adenylate cyclase
VVPRTSPQRSFAAVAESRYPVRFKPVQLKHQPSSLLFQIRVGPEQADASTVIDGERKTVTALFADIKGSTELMQDLDPEEARAIIDPALKLMIQTCTDPRCGLSVFSHKPPHRFAPPGGPND